jgi:diguanylate cyclase
VSWETTKDFGEALTVFAVLALAWGIIHRGLPGPRAADVFLGVLFGGAATYCMLDPLVIMPGVFVDLRSVPVALAAIYLRPCGAIAALAVALTARLMIGGPGIASGSAGLLLTFGAAWLAGRCTGRNGGRDWGELALLGLATSAGLGGLLLLPTDRALGVLIAVGPALVLLHLVGVAISARVIEREQALLVRETTLLRDSTTDPLTALLNRRGFEKAYLLRQADQAGPHGAALILLDMDHFKRINDMFGHDTGDRVLQEVARRLPAVLRRHDLIARLGGEEIAIHLDGVSARQAHDMADRIRQAIAGAGLTTPLGQSITLSASLGVHWAERPGDLTEALQAADMALYAAKDAGRNQVRLAA